MSHAALRGRLRAAIVLVAGLAGAFASGCGASDPAAPPMATPSLTVSPAKVPLGYPVDMTYKFVVASDATFAQDYHVMVHFVDQDGAEMYADDHDPPVPTSAWKPGQTIEYHRLFFAPAYPYVGEATIQIGLYCTGCPLRVPLAGVDVSHRSYAVAHLQLEPQHDGVSVVYSSGWYPPEGDDSSGPGSWHWSRQAATLTIRNPKKDSVFYLKLGNPGGPFKEPQRVTVSLNTGAKLDDFTIMPSADLVLRKIPVTAADWGAGETVDMQLSVDKPFVPSDISPKLNDPRELGIRVFRAVVVPSGP
jgi:hypothetical protein